MRFVQSLGYSECGRGGKARQIEMICASEA